MAPDIADTLGKSLSSGSLRGGAHSTPKAWAAKKPNLEEISSVLGQALSLYAKTFAHRKLAVLLGCFLLGATVLLGQEGQAQDLNLAKEPGAAILIYHRFGEDTLPSTNISIPKFEDHVRELSSGRYLVLPLLEIVQALREKKPLADYSVAVTIDDAFLSVYEEAWPRLRDANIPFTLFFSTDPIDREAKGYMSWAQIREMAKSPLVTLGAHAASHPNLPKLSLEQVRQQLQRGNARIERETGQAPSLLAYPYGTHSIMVEGVARELGYLAAFGQHSGVAAHGSDLFTLPRFSINEQYGDLDRIKLVLSAQPLPTTDLTPRDSTLSSGTNPPDFGFTLVEGIDRLAALQCFTNAGQILSLNRIERRFELRFVGPLPEGRTRINCTMPGTQGRWRWFGRQLYLPETMTN